MTFYDDQIILNKKIENFLSSDLIQEIKDNFLECEELIKEEYDRDEKYDGLNEFYFTYTGEYFLNDHALLKNRSNFDQMVLVPEHMHIKVREKLSKMFFADIFDEIKEHIENTIGLGYVERLAFMNMPSDFQIHTDSLDVKNRFIKRPNNWDDLKKEDYHPDNVTNWPIYQGLINIDAPSNNGTIIFDQWFPYSVYWSPQNTSKETDGTRSAKKDIIFFYSDDQPHRFEESIRNFTGQEISEKDFNLLIEKSPRPDRVKKDEYYGLSIDSLMTFDTPGTLNMWDSKKFHKTIPFKHHGKNQNRLVLQFIAMKKPLFYKTGHTIF